jgi:glycosyltransferase involved in cell wall biosynthesis
MRTIIVEGWRFIPHSYAMVSQFLCLELLARPGIRLLHRDLPYHFSNWRAATGLWPPQAEAKLRAIPAAAPGEAADGVMRMGFPCYFHDDPAARRTLVFATTEFKFVPPAAIGAAVPVREALARAEATLMSPSRWSAEGLIDSGAPRDKVVIVPLGVDPQMYQPAAEAQRAALRKQFGWEGKFVLLNLSAMTFNKGIGLLLKAFAALADRFPQLMVMLKGADEVYPSHDNVVTAFAGLTPEERAKVHARVSYTGQTLPTDTMVALMQAADLYVSPYRAEGFNLPVLEAAACGLPVVCTRGGSTDDFVSDEFAWRIESRLAPGPAGGVMLEPDVAHLTELIARAIEDHGFRRRAADAGPLWVRSRYTWAHVVEELLPVLLPARDQR